MRRSATIFKRFIRSESFSSENFVQSLTPAALYSRLSTYRLFCSSSPSSFSPMLPVFLGGEPARLGRGDGFERTVGALVFRASLDGEVFSETGCREGLWGVVLLGRGSGWVGEWASGGGGVTALAWAWRRHFLLSLTDEVL